MAVKSIKVPRTPDAGMPILVAREISNLREAKHPNVVQLLDVVEDKQYVYLVMEYCSGGDLRDLLNDAILSR